MLFSRLYFSSERALDTDDLPEVNEILRYILFTTQLMSQGYCEEARDAETKESNEQQSLIVQNKGNPRQAGDTQVAHIIDDTGQINKGTDNPLNTR